MMKKIVSIAMCVCLFAGNLVLFGGYTQVSAATPTIVMLTEAIYDELGKLSDGLAKAKSGEDVCFIDATGKVAISSEQINTLVNSTDAFEYGYVVSDFAGGYAFIGFDEYSGALYFDKTGKKVFDIFGTDILGAGVVTEGVAIGRGPAEGVVGLFRPGASPEVYDLYEKDIISTGTHYREGLLNFANYDGLDGYCDLDFNVVIEPQFDNTRPFNQGLAFAAKDGKWGVIDKTGKFVAEPQFDDFLVTDYNYSYTVFVDGLAAVLKGDKWGYIDKQGNTVIDFVWDWPSTFMNGCAVVKKGEKYGYIDTKGNVVLEPAYDDANYFYNGVALVSEGGVYKLIDTTGKAVSDETWDFDTTIVDNKLPNMVHYQQNGKWGLAKITADGGQAPAQTAAPEQEQIKVIFDGKELDFEFPIVNVNGRTFYPMRELFSALGAEVSWDAETRTASGTLDDKKVEFVIGMSEYKVNGEAKTMEAASFIQDSKTYIPIRAAAEGLGMSVVWDADARTITIK